MNIHSIIALFYLFSLVVASQSESETGSISTSGQVGTETSTANGGTEMADFSHLVKSLKNMGVKPGPAIRAAQELKFGSGYTMIKKSEFVDFYARFGNSNAHQHDDVNGAPKDVDPPVDGPEDVGPDDSPEDVGPHDGPKAGTVGLLTVQEIHNDVDESPNNKNGHLLAVQETSSSGISLLGAGDCCKNDNQCSAGDSANCQKYCNTVVTNCNSPSKPGVCAFTDTCGVCSACDSAGACIAEVCGNGCDGNPMDCDPVIGCPAVPSPATCLADAISNQLIIDAFSDNSSTINTCLSPKEECVYQNSFDPDDIMGDERDTKLVQPSTSSHIYTSTSLLNMGFGANKDGEFIFTYDGDSEDDNSTSGPEIDALNLVYKPLDTTGFACPYQSGGAQTGIIYKFTDDIGAIVCRELDCPTEPDPYKYTVEITLTESGGSGDWSQTLEASGVLEPDSTILSGFWITPYNTETQLMNFKFASFTGTGGNITSNTTIGRVKLKMDFSGIHLTGLDGSIEVLKTGCCTLNNECDNSCDNALTYNDTTGVDSTFKCFPPP